MKHGLYLNRAGLYGIVLMLLVIGGIIFSGCSSLPPVMSYQGKLTDASGQPLNGTYTFTFSAYQSSTGGTAVYTENKDVSVTDGLFDTSVGPTTITAEMDPEWLSQPLWLEISINGEVLSPRQQLLGAPYAFTLMPGAVIAATFATGTANGVPDAVLTVINHEDTNPLPALRIEGIGGFEVVGDSTNNSDTPTSAGVIYGQQSYTHSDLRIASNDELYLDLDEDNNSTSSLRIRNGANGEICTINENGDLHCIGNLIFDGTKSSAVTVEEQQRKMYAIESPEVWFEDFGSGTLVNGAGQVAIDPFFAATVDLSDYHVFVTPLGDCQGLYVSNKSPTGFEVFELGGGKANISFDYRVVARRLGYESTRMEILESNAEEEE